MTKRQVWRYRCEFCGKSSCGGGHIARHERGCTANPGRVCEMHKHCEEPQKPVADLIAILKAHEIDKEWTKATEELRQAARGCPACMLAAIRQSGLQRFDVDEDGIAPGAEFEFNFKAELAAFWSVVNERASVEEAKANHYYR